MSGRKGSRLGARAGALLAAWVPLFVAAPAGADEPRLHDGLYVRVGAGASQFRVVRSTERSGQGETSAFVGEESAVGGVALSGEVSVGGTPVRGLAVAGTLLLNADTAPDLELPGGARTGLEVPYTLGFLGPTIDAFPNPEVGFHVGVGAGLLWAGGGIDDPLFDHIGGLGFGLTLHAGYDLWISDTLSAGVALRALLGGVRGEQTAGDVDATERDRVTWFGAMVTLLRH